MNSISRFIILLIATLNGMQSKAQTRMPNDVSEPQNMVCDVSYNEQNGQLKLVYNGVIIAKAKLKAAHGKVKLEKSVSTQGKNDAITQSLQFTGDIVTMYGMVNASDEALAAEGNPLAQEKFALVRTTIGHASTNKRNNAIYDRYSDWVLEINAGHHVQIAPTTKSGIQQSFAFKANSDTLQILFKPLYYQKHKGITYFKPRTYQVWKEPVTGWSSWWAYFRQFNEKDLDQLLSVWKEKKLNKTNHPQIVSTNGHISQGGYDLLNVTRKKNSLSGTSKVVAGDRYELYVHIPQGYQLKSATCVGHQVNVTQDDLATISIMTEETGEVSWKLVF